MNIKTRLILILALLGIGIVVLAVAFMQRGETLTPATTPPPAMDPSGTTDTTAAPDATAPPGATALPGGTAAPEATLPPGETATLATPGETAATTPPDGATIEPDAPAPTLEPTPTLTREEEIVVEMQHHSSQSAASPDECSDILKTEPWCSVTESAKRITRLEWEELLAQTEFFLVKGYLYGEGSGGGPRNLLIVEHDGQRYTAETFDRLLKANGVITITDENRELVAKAFALMTIPDYLEEDVVFTEWEVGEWESGRYIYTNYLKAWTKIQGLEIWWWFEFQDNQLKTVTKLGVGEYHIGDYIDVPFFDLPLPPSKDYHFRGE